MAVENEIVNEGDDDFYAHLFHASKVSQNFYAKDGNISKSPADQECAILFHHNYHLQFKQTAHYTIRQ